jgi:small GTP-binding protein
VAGEIETGAGESATRCGFAAIIGAPNAGKSTLLNQLVGSKLAIVTQKVQTTRTRLRGIVIEGDAQIIFVDTPGIFTPRRSLDEAMVQAAWAGAADADTVLLIVDARFGLDDQAELVIAGLEKAGVKPVLVLNKIDQIRRDSLLKMVKAFNARWPFAATFWSARCPATAWPTSRRTWRRTCRSGPGSTRKTRSPTCRCACWRPKSPAKRSSCGCTRNCPTPRRWRPKAGRSARTARCASTR